MFRRINLEGLYLLVYIPLGLFLMIFTVLGAAFVGSYLNITFLPETVATISILFLFNYFLLLNYCDIRLIKNVKP